MKEAGKRERRTVLVVEDDPNQMTAVCGFLNRLGYVVRSAPDAEEALRLLSEEVPDLLLSDINLPGRSGIEFLTAVRENHSDVAVVMMTAFSSIDSAVECMRRGADDYLAKPLNFAEVQGRLETAFLTRAARVRLPSLRRRSASATALIAWSASRRPCSACFRSSSGWLRRRRPC
jgi:DNA-binding response OmpR family regulator